MRVLIVSPPLSAKGALGVAGHFAKGAKKLVLVTFCESPSILYDIRCFFDSVFALDCIPETWEELGNLLAGIVDMVDPDVVCGPTDVFCRAALGVLSGILRRGVAADCTEVSPAEEVLRAVRSVPSAGVEAVIRFRGRPALLTIAPAGAPDPNREGNLVAVSVEGGRKPQKTSKPKREDVVIVGGRGLGREGIELLLEFGGKVGVEVGVTRAVVDMGWAPRELQIGISGRHVFCKRYIALGVSGSPNHLAGVECTGEVVAVNIDPQAPISRFSDFFVCHDAKEFLKALAGGFRSLEVRGS